MNGEIDAAVPVRSNTGATHRESVTTDTWFRCAIALVLIRVGKRLTLTGAQQLSTTHPARSLYVSTIGVVQKHTSRMPWRGVVPTAGPISRTQLLWVIATLMAIQFTLALFELPRAPFPGHPFGQLAAIVRGASGSS